MVSQSLGRTAPEAVRPLALGISPAQTAVEVAQELYAIGMNVTPQPHGEKEGCLWKFMQVTRLREGDLPEVFAGLCNVAIMVGRTSGNLFVLDYETESGFGNALKLLRARRAPLWAALTARGGHFYFRCEDGPVKSITTGRVPNMEVRAQGGYVLAPPSIHPTGAVYTWLVRDGNEPPTVRASDIDFLRDADGVPVTLQPIRKSLKGRPQLHHATLEYLNCGEHLPVGQRHDAFRRACNNYRDMGYERADMERDLVPIANRSGLPTADDPNELERLMDWAIMNVTPKTPMLPGPMPPNPDAFNWQGRTARSDRAVFRALVERARLGARDGIFRASQRELMALAGIADYHTLGNALTRLTALTLIEKAGTDKTSGATLWKFGRAADLLRSEAVAVDGNHSTGSSQSEDNSAVVYGLLSPTERHLLEILRVERSPLKASDIARQAGLEPRKVKYALRKDAVLRKTGYAARTPAGWCIGIPDKDVLAVLAKCAVDKQHAIRQRGTDERSKDAARRLIRWRLKCDRVNFMHGSEG